MAGKESRSRSAQEIAAPTMHEGPREEEPNGCTAAPETRLAKASLEELEAEVRRRRFTLDELHTERVSLIRRLKVLERQIKSLGGETTDSPEQVHRGLRPRNRTNLVEALAGVLHGRTLTVMEAVGAVQQAGYRTTSPNFRIIVNQALLGNPDRFVKVSRGRYTVRGKA
jgi:hypothetical protein